VPIPQEAFRPFGEGDCESEHSDVYVPDSPFAKAALNPELYLIVGRRGTGKTALARYFSLQRILPNCVHIPIGEGEGYPRLMSLLTSAAALIGNQSATTANFHFVRIWKFAIWSAILEELGRRDRSFNAQGKTKKAAPAEDILTSSLNSLNELLKATKEFDKASSDLLDITPERMAHAREFGKSQPVIISIDTLEKYDINDTATMNALAALIQFAKSFMSEFAPQLQIKVFVPGEIYNHLYDQVLMNPLKHVKSPMFLFWSSADLIKMTSWRLWLYLGRDPNIKLTENVQWTDPRDVYKKVWSSYFPATVDTGENTASFVLRHTQMRPRQLIYLCNEIASESKRLKRFPRITAADVREGVRRATSNLVGEVISSMSLVHPLTKYVLDGLRSMEAVVTADELRTAAARAEHPSLTPNTFLRIAADLGVIGAVTSREGQWVRTEYAYSFERAEPIGASEYAIHPMFHSYLKIKPNRAAVPIGVDQDPLTE